MTAATPGTVVSHDKRRVLFVDDEPLVLEGIRVSLRQYRKQWDTVFTTSGEAALLELESAPFDVLVSDMRMPGMDGATLLGHVQERFPEVLRIMLSGYGDEETMLRSIPVTHQFLAKPCDGTILKNAIERAASLRQLLSDARVREIAGQIDSLPSRPEIYTELTKLLSQETANVAEIGRLLERDIAMCARILQLTNSAFFALPREIARIDEAVAYLGLRVIRSLTLAVSVFSVHEKLPGLDVDAMQRHALLTANIARQIVKSPEDADDAFMAGMLHDVGLLILASEAPERFGLLRDAVRESPQPVHVAEVRLWGTTHAALGAYLLGLWGLPYPIIEAVAHHHDPECVPQQGLDLLAAVHIADALAQEVTGFDSGVEGEAVSPLDAAYLERMGVAQSIEEWRELARTLAASPA